jgi:hypothetical protein
MLADSAGVHSRPSLGMSTRRVAGTVKRTALGMSTLLDQNEANEAHGSLGLALADNLGISQFAKTLENRVLI